MAAWRSPRFPILFHHQLHREMRIKNWLACGTCISFEWCFQIPGDCLAELFVYVLVKWYSCISMQSGSSDGKSRDPSGLFDPSGSSTLFESSRGCELTWSVSAVPKWTTVSFHSSSCLPVFEREKFIISISTIWLAARAQKPTVRGGHSQNKIHIRGDAC